MEQNFWCSLMLTFTRWQSEPQWCESEISDTGIYVNVLEEVKRARWPIDDEGGGGGREKRKELLNSAIFLVSIWLVEGAKVDRCKVYREKMN